MTCRTLPYWVCDRCNRSTLSYDDLEIYQSSIDLDLCEDCTQDGWVICKMCNKIHKKDASCKEAP